MGTHSAGLLPDRTALSQPRADVFAPPGRQLPVRRTPLAGGRSPGWFFVAAHGGAGTTLLSRLSWQASSDGDDGGWRSSGAGAPPAYGMDSGRGWPNPALEPTGRVVVVCQTTMRGLGWARDAAAQHLSGSTPQGLELLGLVTIADQPGRLPHPIRAARDLLAGAYPRTWHLPYVDAYRLHGGLPDEPPPPLHPAVGEVLAAIRSLLLPKGTSA
jgi:hypothetical protein